jgi:hypothetical protein
MRSAYTQYATASESAQDAIRHAVAGLAGAETGTSDCTMFDPACVRLCVPDHFVSRHPIGAVLERTSRYTCARSRDAGGCPVVAIVVAAGS